MREIVALVAVAALVAQASPPVAHEAKEEPRLSKIGAAPEFQLTTQDGSRLALRDLRGKVVVVTFIYTSCADTCPLLTAKLVGLQRGSVPALGSRVVFVGITIDPEKDTPPVLKRYAQAHGADLAGWAFLTGTPAEIRDVVRRFGVYARTQPRGDVDHTFLTSVIDGQGILRVQYLGVRFDPEELLGDIRILLAEAPR